MSDEIQTMRERQPIVDLEQRGEKIILETRDLTAKFETEKGEFVVFQDFNLKIAQGKITAIMGPSGGGKSTFIRAMNRMNETTPGSVTEGTILFGGQDIYGKRVDPVEVRRRIGMVFQKANPFPKTIYDNVAWGAKINGFKGNMDEWVEECLRKAYLWEEVKDDLKTKRGTQLSGGQQQRLCIARAIAVKPGILLMDEPCSALDPIATSQIEDLMKDLRRDGQTIVIVTHNKEQAARVGDYIVFINNFAEGQKGRVLPRIVEYGPAAELVVNPVLKETENFLQGKYS